MSNTKIFAKIHSMRELGKGNFIIDIEIVSLDDAGIKPNTDFILKAGQVKKNRTTNNQGFYRNDEVIESKNGIEKLEILDSNNILISNYYLKQNVSTTLHKEIKDILINGKDFSNLRTIIWSIDENENFIKGQVLLTINGGKNGSIFGTTKQIKAKENGILIKKNIGLIEEYKYKSKEEKLIKNRKAPKGKEVNIEITVKGDFVLGQYAIY